VKLLGAILAGGKSSRFVGDKATAIVDGRALIDHVAAALTPVTQSVIVVGRDWPGMDSIADRPAPNMGPLGGLCGALCHARDAGFDVVITAGCDMMPVVLPPMKEPDIPAVKPVYIADHFLSAIWPAALAGSLEKYLAENEDRSLRSWIRYCDARAVDASEPFYNLNTAQDLQRYQAALRRQESGEE